MDVQTSQEKFLSNDQNKIRLIAILTEKFLNSGVGVIQAEDDADTLIVQTAIQKTQNYRNVMVIGEDIDLIVLLLTLSTTQSDQIIFLKPGRGKTETRFYSIQTLKEKFDSAFYVYTRIKWMRHHVINISTRKTEIRQNISEAFRTSRFIINF